MALPNPLVCLISRFIITLSNPVYSLPGSATGYRTRNGEKLSSTQAEPVQAIKSGVAYFPSISCTTSWRRSRYLVRCWLRQYMQPLQHFMSHLGMWFLHDGTGLALAWLVHEPHATFWICLNMPLSCFRKRMSGNAALKPLSHIMHPTLLIPDPLFSIWVRAQR